MRTKIGFNYNIGTSIRLISEGGIFTELNMMFNKPSSKLKPIHLDAVGSFDKLSVLLMEIVEFPLIYRLLYFFPINFIPLK